MNNKNDNPNKLIIAKNQNDWSNRQDLFKNFLLFRFISKPSTENKIIYNKTIIKSKEKATLKMFN